MSDLGNDLLCADCRCIDFDDILDWDWKAISGGKGTIFLLPDLVQIRARKDCKFCDFITRCLDNGQDVPYRLQEGHENGITATLGEDESSDETRWDVRFAVGPYTRDSIVYELQIYRISEEAVPGTGRRVSKQFDVNILRKWLTCSEGHDQLHSPLAQPRLQSIRVIDIVDQCIKEVDAQSRYFALSYVWGGPQRFRSLQANQARFETPGCFVGVQLPQTIRDAFDLVAQLGERYLYVDSLCIIQDDDKSKMAQVRAMDQIYNGAVAVIITTVGKDANAGLVGFRPGSRKWMQNDTTIGDVIIANCTGQFPLSAERSDCRWATRAWTHQEEMLARRLVIFTSSQVIFSSDRHTDVLCEQVHDCEEDTDPVQSQLDRRYGDFTPFGVYAEVVGAHSRRHITFSTDALNAIAGILAVLEPRLHSEFIFGLPCAYLTLALGWQSITPPVRRRHFYTNEPIFPTWSWAGWVCEVVYHSVYMGTGLGHPYRSMLAFVNPRSKSVLPSAEPHANGLLREKAFEASSFVNPASELLRFEASAAKLWLVGERKSQSVPGLTAWTPLFTSSGVAAGKLHLNQQMLNDLQTGCYELLAISCTHANPHLGMMKNESRSHSLGSSTSANADEQLALEAKIKRRYPGWTPDGRGMPDCVALDAGFDSSMFGQQPWCVFKIMLIEWRDHIAYRGGVGTCHAAAFNAADMTKKRVVLR